MTTATTPVIYTDDQFTALLTAGIGPSHIMTAASSGIAHDDLAKLAATSKDLPAAIAAHQAAAAAAAERLKNAPIKIRTGRDEGVILKAGKNKGLPGDATGALLEVASHILKGKAAMFTATLPCQILAILEDPLTALALAIEVDAGEHDGQGYVRDAAQSCSTELIALGEHYADIWQEPGTAKPPEASAAPEAISHPEPTAPAEKAPAA